MARPKKPYATPRLRVLGTLSEIEGGESGEDTRAAARMLAEQQVEKEGPQADKAPKTPSSG